MLFIETQNITWPRDTEYHEIGHQDIQQTADPARKKKQTKKKLHRSQTLFVMVLVDNFFSYRLQAFSFIRCHKHHTFSRTASLVNTFPTTHNISHPLSAAATQEQGSTTTATLLLMSSNCTSHSTVLFWSVEKENQVFSPLYLSIFKISKYIPSFLFYSNLFFSFFPNMSCILTKSL